MPSCKNWLNENDVNIIYTFIDNIKKYNIIDTNLNNFYLGFKCQKKYNIIIANAWQTAEAVYLNKEFANKIVYIIQDLESLFYDNLQLQQNVLNTYYPEFHYYFVTKYLSSYFCDNYNITNYSDTYMSVNIQKYKNLNLNREKSVVIPYYPYKSNRLPNLVTSIINILSTNNIKCYVYPCDYQKGNINVINLGVLTEKKLNKLYNNCDVGIVFSNSNPSRLGFEMYASGLKVIEYDSEFNKYDMPDKHFKKIKDTSNILELVKELFNTQYNNELVQKLDMNKDFKNFDEFIFR